MEALDFDAPLSLWLRGNSLVRVSTRQVRISEKRVDSFVLSCLSCAISILVQCSKFLAVAAFIVVQFVEGVLAQDRRDGNSLERLKTQPTLHIQERNHAFQLVSHNFAVGVELNES